MKEKIKKIYQNFREFVFVDLTCRYLLLSSIILSFLVDMLWRKYLISSDIFVYTRIGLFPMKYLFLVLLINTVLAYFSHDKEKEISHLLLIGNIALIVLSLSLEIFYSIN